MLCFMIELGNTTTEEGFLNGVIVVLTTLVTV
jgi:hypothetical protein